MVEWLFLSWWGGQGADDEWSHSSDPTTSPGQPTASLQANGLHECWGKKLLMRTPEYLLGMYFAHAHSGWYLM